MASAPTPTVIPTARVVKNPLKAMASPATWVSPNNPTKYRSVKV